MTTKDLWESKEVCCGCELCASSCPKSVIEMTPDEEGFLYPRVVKEQDCIGCSKCIKVCPMKSPGRQTNDIVKGYSGYANDEEEIKTSASGSFATQLYAVFIDSFQGVVYGVRYNNSFEQAVYCRADKKTELSAFKGSKYIQARKGFIYQQVLADLKSGRRVLFIGLPCEISALYHAVGKNTDFLYTVSLICHGPTTEYIQKEYVTKLQKKYKSSITTFSVRYKTTGWKPYYIYAAFKNGRHFLRQFDFSDFGLAFQYMKRPSCSSCQYKYGNKQFGILADLTIGDYHAVEERTSHYHKWGVSQACTHTDKGEELMKLLESSCTLYGVSNEIMAKTNRAFYSAIPIKKEREQFVEKLINKGLHRACTQYGIYVPYMYGRLKKRIKIRIVKFRDSIIRR